MDGRAGMERRVLGSIALLRNIDEVTPKKKEDMKRTVPSVLL